MPPPAPAPVCPYGVLPEDHNSNPCAVKPAPAPAEIGPSWPCGTCGCPYGESHPGPCEGHAVVIAALHREVAALQALSRDQATIIRNTRADAEAEVAALMAWKAEALERGAEMARRGLEVCAERDALKADNERLREALNRVLDGFPSDHYLRAALKGDGQSPPPPRWNVTDPPPGCSLRVRHDPHAPMSKALGCSPRAHRRR